MVAVEPLSTSATRNTLERWGKATADLPGAFLHGWKYPCEARGRLTELLIKLEQSYRTIIFTMIIENLTVYVKLMKSIYGTIQAAMLFRKTL